MDIFSILFFHALARYSKTFTRVIKNDPWCFSVLTKHTDVSETRRSVGWPASTDQLQVASPQEDSGRLFSSARVIRHPSVFLSKTEMNKSSCCGDRRPYDSMSISKMKANLTDSPNDPSQR